MDEIIKDFTFSNKSSDLIELKFLKKVSKSSIAVSKKTGLVFYNEFKRIVSEKRGWGKKFYSNKMNPKKNLYCEDFPEVNARHYYVLDFLNKFINLKNKRIIDFAFGQGGLLLKARKYFGIKNLLGVEYSKENILLIKKRFKENKFNIPKLYNSNIEEFVLKKKADIGVLTWTLCNCAEPLKIIKSISENIKTNGYLIVAEGSRILVPFKKPIHTYLNPHIKVSSTHPWHFSFNSLNNIFKVFGFELIKKNRYLDENNLVLIFKNSKKFNQKMRYDSYSSVVNFFKRWDKESKNYKKFSL